MDEIRTSFWDSVFVVSGKLSQIVLAMFSIALMTRLLGVVLYGKLSLFLSITNMFFLLGLTWTATAMVRFGKEEFVKNEKINKTLWSRNIIVLPIITLIIVILWLLRARILAFIGVDKDIFLLLIFVYTICLVISEYRLYLLQSTKRLKLYSFVQPIERILIVIGLCLVMLKILPTRIDLVIFIFITATIITSVPIFFLLKRYLFPIDVDFQYIKKMLFFSYPFFFGGINFYLFYWLGVILIKKYMTIADVGIYSLAKNGANIVEQITMSTAVVTIPLIISLAHNNKEHLIKKYIQKAIPYGILAVSLGISTIIFFSKPLISLLGGQEFNSAVVPFAGLLVGYTASGISSLYAPLIINYSLIKQSVIIDAVGIATNIILGFLLIPQIGINGAVIAVLVNSYVVVFLRMRLVRQRLEISTFHYVTLTAPVFLTFYLFVRNNNFYTIIIGIALFCILLFYLKRKFDFFNEEDLWILEQIDMPVRLKGIIKSIFRFNLRHLFKAK